MLTSGQIRKEREAHRALVTAVERHVRNWLISGLTIPIGSTKSLDELISVDVIREYGNIYIRFKSNFVEPEVYAGLWVSDKQSQSVMITGSSVNLGKATGTHITISGQQTFFDELKPVPKETEPEIEVSDEVKLVGDDE